MRTPQADFALAKLLTMYPQRYADAAGEFYFSKITESEGLSYFDGLCQSNYYCAELLLDLRQSVACDIGMSFLYAIAVIPKKRYNIYMFLMYLRWKVK
jgi:hypothetical protein